MKNFVRYLGLAAVIAFTFTACEEATIGSDEPLNFNTGINVAGFPSAEATASIPVTGEVDTYKAEVLVNGPNVQSLNGEVTLTFSVDESSTAVVGTHYLPIDSNTITLNENSNYLATIPVKIITENSTPPASETLVLNIESIQTNEESVVLSGNNDQVVITINYLCFSDLAGEYVINYSSGPVVHTVVKLEPGLYECNFFPGFPGDTTGAFTFTENCGELTMLEWGYSNEITGTGHVDEATGDIIWDSVTVDGVSGYENLSWVMVKQ